MARKKNTTRRRSNKTAAKRRSRKPARDERAIRSLSGLAIILLTLTGLFKPVSYTHLTLPTILLV